MTEYEINLFIQKQGIKKADIVRKFQTDFDHLSESYAKKMIYGLISGSTWNARYAKWLKTEYAITVKQPDWAAPVRKRMRKQAA